MKRKWQRLILILFYDADGSYSISPLFDYKYITMYTLIKNRKKIRRSRNFFAIYRHLILNSIKKRT